MIKIKNKFLIDNTKNNKDNKLIALDVDGTICKDSKYNTCFDLFIENKYLLSSLTKYSLLKECIVVFITNQSGLSRNYFQLSDYKNYIKKVMLFLQLNYSIKVREVFLCPHQPIDKCKCRKPSGEMLNSAIKKYNIKNSSVIMIGDKEIDKYEMLNATNNKGRFINAVKDFNLENLFLKK